MEKKCLECKETKQLGEFFGPPIGSANRWTGSSRFCKTCHEKGLIVNGYGYYKDKWFSPDHM